MVMTPITFTIDVATLGYKYIKGKTKYRSVNEQSVLTDSYGLYSLDSLPSGEAPVARQGKGDVTVVITVHKNSSGVKKIIPKVFEQDYPPNKVYISGSGLGDIQEIVEGLSKEYPNLYHWSKPGVTSKGKKINELIRDPNVDLGDYVYFIDSAINLHPGAIRHLVDKISESGVDAVTSYGYVTPPKDMKADFFHYGKEWANRMGKFRKTAQGYRRAMAVVCGASFMVKSDVMREVGMPTLTKTEDTAFTWRLQKTGYKVEFAPESIVHSEDVTTIRKQLDQSYRWYIGTWQNIYLHSDVFGPHSSAKALAYTTVLPGLIESTAYAATILALPLIALLEPKIAEYFVIGDTTLSLVAPVVAPSLSGDFKDTPKEIIETIKRYPQITAYKILSSALWIASGAKVTYDVLRGNNESWKNEW